MPMQNASVSDVFRNICPWTKTCECSPTSTTKHTFLTSECLTAPRNSTRSCSIYFSRICSKSTRLGPSPAFEIRRDVEDDGGDEGRTDDKANFFMLRADSWYDGGQKIHAFSIDKTAHDHDCGYIGEIERLKHDKLWLNDSHLSQIQLENSSLTYWTSDLAPQDREWIVLVPLHSE